jgi:hypothetical protein
MGPMLRWFVFTIAMGLLPFGFSILLQVLRGVPPSDWQNSPELLFFSVMVSASQLDGIFASFSSGPSGEGEGRGLLNAMFGWFLIIAIFAAALYGVYMDHARNDPARVVGSACAAVVRQVSGQGHPPGIERHCGEWLAFRANLFTLSMWMAGLVGITGTISEWIRTRRPQ